MAVGWTVEVWFPVGESITVSRQAMGVPTHLSTGSVPAVEVLGTVHLVQTNYQDMELYIHFLIYLRDMVLYKHRIRFLVTLPAFFLVSFILSPMHSIHYF
jgi:hypothetical protein